MIGTLILAATFLLVGALCGLFIGAVLTGKALRACGYWHCRECDFDNDLARKMCWSCGAARGEFWKVTS